MGKFKYTLIVFGITIAAMMLSCGGVGTPKKSLKEICKDRLGDFTKDGDHCDPISIEQLELDIKSWEQECGNYVLPEDRFGIADFLARSHECSDHTRALEARRGMCISKIREMGNRECVGAMCDLALKEASGLIKECRQFEYSDDTLLLADRLIEYLKARVFEVVATNGFKDLSMECTQTVTVVAGGSADEKAILGKLLLETSQQDKLAVPGKKGSPLEVARLAAVTECGAILHTLVGNTLEKSSKEMRKGSVKRKPEIWMEHFHYIENVSKDLQVVGGAELFPEATSAAEKALAEFVGFKEKTEKAALKKITSKTMRVVKKDIKKCKKQSKKIEQFKTKVKKHTDSGNKKRASAYQSKLDKLVKAVGAKKTSLKQTLTQEDLPESVKQLVQKELDKSGLIDKEPAKTPEPEKQ